MTFQNTSCDIPDDLIFKHEEGKVVFFCGAGISYDAGIPVFKGLYESVRGKLGVTLHGSEEDAEKTKQYDRAFQYLEKHVGSMERVRSIAAKYLSPIGRRLTPNGLSKHKSLLQLAKTRESGLVHLVTTNYDPLFDHAVRALRLSGLRSYQAPLLPIPRPYDWNGIVYLHGKLDVKSPSRENLNSLVLTSGDFGSAYLSERWAARFVSELFRNFTICFIGYSVNDVILRYMVDAIASQEMRGCEHKPVYAFDGCEEGQETSAQEQWKSKGIELVPYRKVVSTINEEKHEDHSELRVVLEKWAQTYAEAESGKVRIVLDEMAHEPDTVSNEGKAVVRRVAWALSDQTGVPAQHLAKMNPLPSIKWMDALAHCYLPHEWLTAFGVHPSENKEDKVKFSVLNHPPKLTNAPIVGPVPRCRPARLDTHQERMLDWIMRYLNSWQLLNWFVASGGVPSYEVCHRILDELPGRCDDFRLNEYWRMYLQDALTYGQRRGHVTIFEWIRAYDKFGRVTPALAAQFRSYIQPCLRFGIGSGRCWEEKDALQAEVDLVVDDLKYLIDERREGAAKVLAPFMRDLEINLGHICELRNLVDGPEDFSYFNLPTIEEGDQPKCFGNWTTAVVLLRDAWLGLLVSNESAAVSVAKKWANSEYTIFWRLYLFAATECHEISIKEVVKFLEKVDLFGDGKILHHEIIRFIDERGGEVSAELASKLEGALLSRDDVEHDRLHRSTCAMFLDHLEQAGARLSERGKKFLDAFKSEFPSWSRRNRKYDGLRFYVSDGAADYEEEAYADEVKQLLGRDVPMDNDDAVRWLVKYDEYKGEPPSHLDPWRKVCEDDPERAMRILLQGSEKQVLRQHRSLKTALEMWRKPELAIKAWEVVTEDRSALFSAEMVKENFAAIAEWICAVARSGSTPEKVAGVCKNMLAVAGDMGDREFESDDKGNSPYRALAEATLRAWYALRPQRNSQLKPPFSEVFTEMASGRTFACRAARTKLLEHTTDFYIVDKAWTQDNIVPLLSWQKNLEAARLTWSHIVRSPRYDSEFMRLVKTEFVDTATRYLELDGVSQDWYSALVAHMALTKCVGYTPRDFAGIIRRLPVNGREFVARHASSRMNESVKGDLIWRNEFKQFVERCWPVEAEYMTAGVAGHIVCAITKLDECFETAIKEFVHRIPSGFSLDVSMSRLWMGAKGQKTLSECYPWSALLLLDHCDFPGYLAKKAKKCREQIESVDTDGKIRESELFKSVARKIRRALAKFG